MSKDSHFTGQPVYSQVLKLLDKEIILQISRETKGSEAFVKRFDCYQHLVLILFGILNHFDSLRELEIGMKAEAHKLVHLGMDYLQAFMQNLLRAASGTNITKRSHTDTAKNGKKGASIPKHSYLD